MDGWMDGFVLATLQVKVGLNYQGFGNAIRNIQYKNHFVILIKHEGQEQCEFWMA